MFVIFSVHYESMEKVKGYLRGLRHDANKSLDFMQLIRQIWILMQLILLKISWTNF